jgi:hypothetical protein
VGSAGQRERTCACSKKTAPTGLAHRAAGGREGGAGARVGWAYWADLDRNGGFHFPEISNAFLFISLGFSIQIQTKFQFQIKSNMCNNSKNI